MSDAKMKVGDVITRDGTDRQRITAIDHSFGLITVECVRASHFNWCEVGDVEDNIIRRYSYPEGAIDA